MLESPAELPAVAEFFDEGLIVSVSQTIKSGKEATTYLCVGGGELAGRDLVAKVYHDRTRRNFANDAVYQEGRIVLDARADRAINAKSSVGRSASAALWVDHEFETLSALHYAGADVPEVFAATEGAILMEHISRDGETALQLQHARLGPGDAQRALDRLLWNIELWLDNHVVHADLSPFNVLWDGERAVVIDFPQAVDPRFAPAARRLLARDIGNIGRSFQRYGLVLAVESHVEDLWRRFESGALG